MKLTNGMPVVVTGGASGLGAAVAARFAQSGARVGILDMNRDAGMVFAAKINGAFAPCDVSDPMDVAQGLQILRDQHGQERVTVNCAGIAPGAKTVSRGAPHDPELFAKTMAINLNGTFYVASQSAAGMASAEPLDADGTRGMIINTASIAAFEGQVGQVAYAASKAGIAGLTLPMARDLAKSGIRVMAIAPGVFATPMVTEFPPEVQTKLAEGSEFPKRLGHVDEYAAFVLQIISNQMLNGEVIRLDAARRMQA